MFVSSGKGEYGQGTKMNADRLFINAKNGPFIMQEIKNLSLVNGRKVINGDFNKDGYEDILLSARVIPDKYPLPRPQIRAL